MCNARWTRRWPLLSSILHRKKGGESTGRRKNENIADIEQEHQNKKDVNDIKMVKHPFSNYVTEDKQIHC